VLGDPRVALTWLANELPARGAALRGGDIVFTGVTTVPVPVVPGMRLAATFGDGLGRIAADFATS
jgi:2-keto-4-pentenoate hydratase